MRQSDFKHTWEGENNREVLLVYCLAGVKLATSKGCCAVCVMIPHVAAAQWVQSSRDFSHIH